MSEQPRDVSKVDLNQSITELRRISWNNSGRPSRAGIALGIISVIAFVFIGCGSSSLNSRKIEDAIQQGVSHQTGVKIASVSCPDNIVASQGDTFTCTIHGVDGTTAPVKVRQADNTGRVNYNVDLVRIANVERGLSNYVSKYLQPTKYAHGPTSICPDVVLTSKGQITCKIIAPTDALCAPACVRTLHADVTLGRGQTFTFTIK